eukprot:3323055-Pyramimonas_sp.AAC.1
MSVRVPPLGPPWGCPGAPLGRLGSFSSVSGTLHGRLVALLGGLLGRLGAIHEAFLGHLGRRQRTKRRFPKGNGAICVP